MSTLFHKKVDILVILHPQDAEKNVSFCKKGKLSIRYRHSQESVNSYAEMAPPPVLSFSLWALP